MKYILAIALFLTLLSFAQAHADHVYDWSAHNGANELYQSLKDETDSIFILYWFKSAAGNEVLKKQNEDMKGQIQKDVLANHPEIIFSEIDMTEPAQAEKYKLVFNDVMQIKVDELTTGPVVAVVNNGEGAWIHGKGTVKEVAESVDIFVHEAKDRRNGGTGSVYGSDKARKDGSISVGNTSY